jgi:uncharacterized protein
MNTRKQDHGSMVVETHELPRRPGEQIQLNREFDAPEQLGIDMIGVPVGSPLNVSLSLSSVGDGILVTGQVEANLSGQCGRCLNSFTSTQSFEVQELYYYLGKTDEEDVNWVLNDQLDLEPAIRDAIVLNLPFAPLCAEDCAGLCPQCGINLNDEPDHEHREAIDPRWAKLADLSGPTDA